MSKGINYLDFLIKLNQPFFDLRRLGDKLSVKSNRMGLLSSSDDVCL